MTDVTRFLFMAGRFPLRRREYQAAFALAFIFWPDGERITEAQISPERMHRRGVGSAPVWTTRALRGLVGAGMLEPHPTTRHRYALRADELWHWKPRRTYERVLGEWSALQGHAWQRPAVVHHLRDAIVSARKHPDDPFRDVLPPTFHHDDLDFRAWIDGLEALVREYDEDTVMFALEAVRDDPPALVPFTIDAFTRDLYALAARGRRNAADLP